MPLTRETVTSASRIMLPAYVALAAAYGIVYLLDPLGRLAGAHSLDVPRAVMGGSMRPWGVLFLGLAGFLALCLLRHSRKAYVFGACVAASAWVLWAGMYAASIFTDPMASVLAPVGPLFYVTAIFATSVSLLRREV